MCCVEDVEVEDSDVKGTYLVALLYSNESLPNCLTNYLALIHLSSLSSSSSSYPPGPLEAKHHAATRRPTTPRDSRRCLAAALKSGLFVPAAPSLPVPGVADPRGDAIATSIAFTGAADKALEALQLGTLLLPQCERSLITRSIRHKTARAHVGGFGIGGVSRKPAPLP